MKIEISNQQKKMKIRLPALRAYCRWIMQQVQTLDPTHHWTELSLALADHERMAEVHAAFMGSQRTTDVISFAYAPQPPATHGYAGDVIVNIEQAVEQGPLHSGVAWEVALYIAHGCHHLTGADDCTPVLRQRMRRIETAWLRRATAEGLIAPLLLDSKPGTSTHE